MLFTEDEVEFIKADLVRKGITVDVLRNDLTDHLLCSMEESKKAGVDFHRSYEIAWQKLNGSQPNDSIQQETKILLSDSKNIFRNLIILSIAVLALVVIFFIIKKNPNPALILVCLSSGIFFMYHSLFYLRRNHSARSKSVVFILITSIPATGVLLSSVAAVIPNSPKMILWYLFIFLVAIPVYHRVMCIILKANGTALSFLKQLTEFMGIASFLWIPLAGSLILIRPEVNVQFLPDLVVQGSCCLLFSWFIGWMATRKELLRNIFHTYLRG